MMFRLVVTMIGFFSAQALAEEAIITGNVESKCVINTDVNGVYGNPSSGTLSTLPADGGIMPIIRYDVALGDAYTAKITAPNSFSTSPSLSDVVAWTGDVEVSEVSDTPQWLITRQTRFNTNTRPSLTCTQRERLGSRSRAKRSTATGRYIRLGRIAQS